jgi:hypothetical protein
LYFKTSLELAFNTKAISAETEIAFGILSMVQ